MITGSHGRRPAEVVALERVQQLVDVSALEAAEVVNVVEVARGRADEHQCREQLGHGDRGGHPDHRRNGVPNEDDVTQSELVTDLHHVIGVAVQRGIAVRVVRGEIRVAGADVVEQGDAMIIYEVRDQAPPHALVAAEPVRHEEHRGVFRPEGRDAVPFPVRPRGRRYPAQTR